MFSTRKMPRPRLVKNWPLAAAAVAATGVAAVAVGEVAAAVVAAVAGGGMRVTCAGWGGGCRCGVGCRCGGFFFRGCAGCVACGGCGGCAGSCWIWSPAWGWVYSCWGSSAPPAGTSPVASEQVAQAADMTGRADGNTGDTTSK
jgi:hypothetical protein